MPNPVHHALVLNLHQPAGNLQELMDSETPEILRALDRIPRVLWAYEDVARVHFSISGTLLETLSDPQFQESVYGIADCGSLLWHFQNLAIFRILGTGYYHPVFPLIPEEDRLEQLSRWHGIASHLFWRKDFQGFWPPEMGFCMEMIPLLRKAGYRYVLVDSEHVRPLGPMTWQELHYRPHIANYNGSKIVVVVRDRDLSNAQQSGMDFEWFSAEIKARTRWCDFPPLVVTATDGDNGGWFRNPEHSANFWGFYRNLLDEARRARSEVRPVFIEDYLDLHGAEGEVHVETGAWNTGWHHGRGFVQWTGSRAQKDALSRVAEVSRVVHEARRMGRPFEAAMWRLLRAETSCNFFWGESWVHRAHCDLDESLASLER